MKSWASYEAKVNYIRRDLNKQLHKERIFPLMMHFSFTGHIWPRCELLRDNGIKAFDLESALLGTDEEFCKRYSLDTERLEAKKNERPQIDEQDQLWAYVPGIWEQFVVTKLII